MGIKNVEFYADFVSVKNDFKNAPKKSYGQKRDGTMHFFTFIHVRQTCFANDFF